MADEILFDEVLLDPGLFTLGDATGSAELANTLIRAPGTGVMKVNVPRYDPQHVWNMDFKMLTPSDGGGSTNEMDYFNDFWYGGWGSAWGFRVRIETDNELLGEVLGISDGTEASKIWKITKTYRRPGTTRDPYIRYLCKPVVTTHLSDDSVTLYEPNGETPRVLELEFKLYFDDVEVTSGFTVSNTTGIITLDAIPPEGTVVSIDCQFDTPMRFFSNSYQQKADRPAEIKGMPLVEIMPEELGL